jgi:DNA-binding transcriptional LysR family regulator
MSIPAIRNVIPANQLLFPFSRARTGSSEVLAGQVSAGDLDTAIVMMESASRPATPLIGRIIATLDVAIVQSRRRPLVREPIRPAGLAKHAWILNPNGCRYRAGLENAMGQRDRSLHVVIDTHGTEVQLRMVASGRGLGLVPLSITIKKDWT